MTSLPPAYANPPAYSGAPPPSFSPSLHPGEERLQFTPSPLALIRPTGTVRRRSKHGFSASFFDQQEGSSIPQYDRNEIIHGVLSFDCESLRRSIVRVNMSVLGDFETSTLGLNAGNKQICVLHECLTLWSKGNPGDTVSSPICPPLLLFSQVIPSSFLYEDGRRHRLPPSHNLRFMLGTGVSTMAKYRIKIEVVTKGILGTKLTKTLRIPIDYRPRTRPPLPISSSNVFETLKCAPEEWFQRVCSIEPRNPKSGLNPVSYTFLVPDVRIHGLEEAIPFHLQMSGLCESLRYLFPNPTCPRFTDLDAPYTIRVSLERRFRITIHGTSMTVSQSIGEGKLHRTWPSISQDPEQKCTTTTAVYDWTGHIRVRDPDPMSTPPTFSSGNVLIQDYIVLSIIPPHCHRQPLYSSTRTSIPIKMVTDVWDSAFASEDSLGLI